MADVLSSYRTGDAFDEMMDPEGSVRPSYQAVYSALSRSTSDDLRMIAESLANNYTQAGVTFDVGGVERPFPLDLVPRVIASPEWEIIEAGVAQRVKALEAFLADIYSDARVITDGVIPSQLVTSSTHFHRAVWGIKPVNGVRIHVAGVDLIRNPAGDVRVLEDNVRVPSGVSYVMTNRNAMITAMPEAFANQRIRPVAGYPTRLLTALRKAAPPGVDEPTVVVLTPGVSTRPTSSTPCWRAQWALNWLRAVIWSAVAARSSCAPPPDCSGWTLSIAGSMTILSIRCISGVTRCSACQA